MSDHEKITYNQLDVGYEFPEANFSLDPSAVSAYLASTEDSIPIYAGTGKVPPTAIAAWALASLLEYIDLPAGTIHLTQEVRSLKTVSEGTEVTCKAKVSRKQERGKLKLLNIDIDVVDPNQETLLSSKSSFNLPQTST